MEARDTDRQGLARPSPVERHSVAYNLFILVLTVFSLTVTVGLLAGPGKPHWGVLVRADHLVCTVFAIDFALNLYRAPDRAAYFFRQGGWLDLLGAIPVIPGLPWTALFRMARLVSLSRVVRHLRRHDRGELIRETRRTPGAAALLTITIAAFVLVTIVSLLVLLLERDAPGATITTGEDAFWWSVVTVTTVGYGDYVPVTMVGRLLALVLMIFGIGIFGVLTSLMARRISRLEEAEEDPILAMRQENAAMRAELSEIRSLLADRSQLNSVGGDSSETSAE